MNRELSNARSEEPAPAAPSARRSAWRRGPSGAACGGSAGRGPAAPAWARRSAPRPAAGRRGLRGRGAVRDARRSSPGPAAALAPDLQPGDLVVATEVIGPGGGGHRAARRPRCWPASCGGPGCTCTGRPDRHRRPACCDAAGRRGARPRRAIAVDMESAYLLAGAPGGPAGRSCSGRSPTPASGRCCGRAGMAGGIAALRSLRLAAPALARWAAAAGPRQVLLAGPRSFCAGVERAIEIVERALDGTAAPVYVRKQIVHNTHVVAGLEQRGAIFVDELQRGAGRGHGGVLRARRGPGGAGRGRPARAGHRRRDLPAGGQGARGGPPVRRRRLPGRADRARRARGSRGHARRGAGGHCPGPDRGRRGQRWSPPTRPRWPT